MHPTADTPAVIGNSGAGRRVIGGVSWLPSSGRDETMRYVFTGLLLLFALTMAACSFSVDFAVINESERPIDITYKIGETGIEPLAATRKPAILPASRISSREWQELSPAEYSFDSEKRTVTVSLRPGHALRVYQGGEGDAHSGGGNFIIRELSLRGPGGEVTYKGDQVYKGFVAVPRPSYAFGPDTVLLTLTYK
jgi:hypothetical protein